MSESRRNGSLLRLQRQYGNRFIQKVLGKRAIQAKLVLGKANDQYEQEADRVASQIVDASATGIQRQVDPEEEEEEETVQAKAVHEATLVPGWDMEKQIKNASGLGQPVPYPQREHFESRLGYDFSQVRVHNNSESDRLNRSLNARAFTTGKDIFFREGEYSLSSTKGRELLAHELTHTIQQGAIQRVASDNVLTLGDRAAVGKRVSVSTGDSLTNVIQKENVPSPGAGPVARPDPFKVVPAPTGTTGVATALSTFILNAKGGIVAIVDQGTELKVTGVPKPEDLEAVQKGQFWARPGDTKPGLYDLYYEVEYFGRMGGTAKDQPIKGYVFTSWLALKGTPSGQSQAVTGNDWMTTIPDHGQKGDPDAIARAAKAIEAERKGIEQRAFVNVAEDRPKVPRAGVMSKSKGDARIQTYLNWLSAPDTRPSIATGTNDIRWLAFKKLFPAEGDPSKIMTYDYTNITWGVGFSGAGRPGVGLTEQMMARLFNQSTASRDAFWRAGITVVGTEMVAVKITDALAGKAEKLRGTMAENFVRTQKDLLSLMSNVTIGLHTPGQQDPDEIVRQQNLDAQFETFLNNTLAGSEGIIDGMDPKAAAVAAHSRHTGQHGWGQYLGVTTLTGVRSVIRARIAMLETQKAADEAAGRKPKFSYIVPLDQIEAHIK